MAESSGYGHLRRPPKLKNFCTWVAFIRNMDSHASQKWSSSTDHKPNEALPPCGPCDLCWVQDVRKGEVNVQRFVSLVTWPHLSSCQGSTRYLCTCHNHCQCAFPWCNTKGLNQDKFKSAKPISFCTSLLTTSCSIVPRLAISPYRTITPYPIVPCLAMRYIPISWNVYSVLSYHIRLYHVFSYYPCTPVKTGAHPPVAICLWQGSFLWAVSNPNTLEQSWGTDFWEIKKYEVEPINATILKQFHTSKMCNHENLFKFQGWAGCFWRTWVKVKHTNWKCVLQVQVSSVNPNSKDVCLQTSVFHGNMFWVAHSFLIP